MYHVTVYQAGAGSIEPTTCATLEYARKLSAQIARDEKATYRGTGYTYHRETGDAVDSRVIERRVFKHPVFGTDLAITIRSE